MMSSLRTLQMRVTYLLASTVVVNPAIYAYVALELGKTAADAPDAWCFLATSQVTSHACACACMCMCMYVHVHVCAMTPGASWRPRSLCGACLLCVRTRRASRGGEAVGRGANATIKPHWPATYVWHERIVS